MAADTGGPAFPFTPNMQKLLPDGTWDQDHDPGDEGMTLWDYYAAHALAGLLAGNVDYEIGVAAEDAANHADTLIAEKRQREGDE